MKKTYLLAIAFTLVFIFSAYAEETEAISGDEIINLSSLSSEDLLYLRNQIDNVLDERGFSLRRDLERGDKGDDVIALQLRLEELGFFNGVVNGKYDTVTQKAMKNFEKTNGLQNDGLASREDQRILFGDNVIVSKESDPQETEKETDKAVIDSDNGEYESFDYVAVMRNPEMFEGNKIFVFGRVLQVIGKRENMRLRMGTSGYSDPVLVSLPFDPGYNYIEGDLVKVYGSMTGTTSYTAVLGNRITVPTIEADEIELK